ncbi:MAG TPA: MFS transporter [Pyrinomonadaceae bacterium]|jgi:MFS transporter, ACS family, tartrate transporter
MKQTSGAGPIAERTRRRITRRLMPYLFFLYVIAYLDRVNLGFAALDMKGDLHFADDVIGFGAGIFFVGYVLLEIPGCILVEKWSARRWIARIMISWGIVAVLMGLIQTKTQFYSLRFLLGAAEAGFFPGVIVYLSHWFRYEDRARVLAMFMAAQPLSNIIGSPISGKLLEISWFGLAGWRWLFILEGMPAIIFGFITIFYLTDRPLQARWLPEDERLWLTSELEKEKDAKQEVHSLSVWQALRHREVILLTLCVFCMASTVYGFNFWLPAIIKKASGSTNSIVGLISALPYCVGLIAILFIGWSSDRTRERRWHTALSMVVASIGLLAGIALRDQLALAVAMFCLAAVGMYGYLPSFWALPTSFLSGTAAAASIGLINSVGNLGGFVGPSVVGYVSKATNSFFGGVLYLSLTSLVAAVLVLSIRATRRRAVELAERAAA